MDPEQQLRRLQGAVISRRSASALLLFALFLVPLGATGSFWNPNELSRLALSVSLAEYSAVQIDHVLDDYGVVPGDMSVRDDHAYSDKAPGMSFLGAVTLLPLDWMLPREGATLAPQYWPLRNLLTALLVCLPTALFFGVFAPRQPAFAEFGVGQAQALAGSVLFALTTPVLTYTSVFFSHVPAGLMIAVAFALTRELAALSPQARDRRALLVGALASFAVVTEYPAILLGATVVALVGFDPERRRALPMVLVGAAIAGIPFLAYNKVAWDAYFTTGYAFKSTSSQAAIHSQGFFGVRLPTWNGLWGILFSARRGLLAYSPILVCIGLGIRRMWHVRRAESIATGAATVAYVAFAAGFVDWEGGWSAAARHLVPVLPLLLVPFCVGLQAMWERTATAVAGAALAGVSATAILLGNAVTSSFPEVFTNPIGQVVLPALREGFAMRNILSDLIGVSPHLALVVYACGVLAAAGMALRALVPENRRRLVAAVFASGMLGYIALQSAASRSPQDEDNRAGLLRRMHFEEQPW